MKKTLLKFAGIGLLFVYSFFSGRYLASLFSLPSSSAETAASSEAVGNWGLGFQKDGTRPTANATIDELKKYNAHYAADTRKKKIYLTFDCGYENGNTGKILDALKKHHAKATFFMVGNFITSNPELVKRIQKEGHIAGNHTYHHPDMSKMLINRSPVRKWHVSTGHHRANTASPILKWQKMPVIIRSSGVLPM